MMATDHPQGRPTVVVAGATGFIGERLISRLLPSARVHALSRRSRSHGSEDDPAGPVWIACDLFSMRDTRRAVKGADIAVYLVHSMLPSARLTQGSFHDMDLILADNFARACAHAGVDRIVYLSGLVPESEQLSAHLASREEVERALQSYGASVTALRAGMIVGAGGSSFRMLHKLVQRLPWMVCPAWTQSQMQPIDVDDVVELLARCVERSTGDGGVYDIGGPDIYSYRGLIEETGRVVGRRIRILDFPSVAPSLSVLWVCLVTRTPRALVGPLVESLRHDMVARDRRLQEETGVPGIPFEASVRRAIAIPPQESSLLQRWRRPSIRSVRSVQRVRIPIGRSADWLTREYLRWLPTIAWPLVSVEVDERLCCEFRLKWLGVRLLRLELATGISIPNRVVLRITGGVLVRAGHRPEGRLEFRSVLDGSTGLVAIHDFRPSLPWFVYKYTQALAHSWVMKRFARHLRRESERAQRRASSDS
jgi:uncharacterized protein YbjT (DUF2867 family)